MANSNSTTSLYTVTSNVSVSANNFTTLYSATAGNVVTANVPDRNFTTLYTKQSDINPTYPYGNSNVEAFLNVGSDSGGNIVNNINMEGNLNVGGSTNLGPVGNITITGGTYNYVLTTDGTGNLSWTEQQGASGNGVPYIHFDVSSTANNQSFSDADLENYQYANAFSLFKNGVNIEPTYYEKTSANTVQVNILLNNGDTIDILPSSGGGSGNPGGNNFSVQFNGGGIFDGSDTFTFNPVSDVVTANNITATSITGNINSSFIQVANMLATGTLALGNVGNVKITGGSSDQFLRTDGLGNLTWAPITSNAAATSVYANVANVNIFDGANGQVLSTNGSGNLSWTSFIANANYANTANIANTANYANSANTANTATTATSATTASTAASATIALEVANAYQPNITSTGTLTGLTSNGTINFTGANSVQLGVVGNVKITGGSASQVLSTDGTGNLSWQSVAIGVPNYANFAGEVVNSSQSNITSVGTLTSLTVGGMTTIQEAKEKYTGNGTGATGTVTFDVLTSAIILQTANASANFTLNIRGNSTTTFNSITSTDESTSITYINKNGATGYYANTIQIDGSTVTPVYVNGSAPSSGTVNGYDVYNFNILKTGVSTYVVFMGVGSYQ